MHQDHSVEPQAVLGRIEALQERIRVVTQRSKGDPDWVRINIQRGKGNRPLANPYPLKDSDGNSIRSAAEASELFWQDFSEQITHDTPQRQKLSEIAALLRQGKNVELGCCGDPYCHGHRIRNELVSNHQKWVPEESEWQPPHILELDGWIEAAHQLLEKHWGDTAAFAVELEEETSEKGIKISRCVDGPAALAAGRLLMEFEVSDPSVADGKVTEESMGRYLAMYLYWGALKAHVEPDCPTAPVLEETWQRFSARVKLRLQGLAGVEQVNKAKDGNEVVKRMTPEDALAWIEAGCPQPAQIVTDINGRVIQVDVVETLSSGLKEIHQSGLGGSDLTGALLELAVRLGQPFHSIKKAYDEFCGGVIERQMFDSVLDTLLEGTAPVADPLELVGERFVKMVIDDFAQQFKVDPMLVLLTVLSAMGSVLPLRTRVRGLSHTQHWRPGVLFVMILVVSGGMKSMLLEELVEKPIVGGAVGERARKLQKRAIGLKKIMDKFHDSYEEAEGWQNAPEWLCDYVKAYGVPGKMAHVVSDFTGEGIDRNAQLIEEFGGYRTGFLLTTDEGRQLMGGDRYKSSSKGSAGSKYTIDKLKRAWDAKGPASVRGNKSLERNYDRIRLGILAFIQPEVYDEIAGDETDDACGFWPRFLAYESDPVQLQEGLTPADRRSIAERSTFRRYLDRLYGAVNGLHVPGDAGAVEFHFDQQAEDWWYPIQCQLGRESVSETASGDGVMGRLLGKLPALVVDVSLLLHLIRTYGEKPELMAREDMRWNVDDENGAERVAGRLAQLDKLSSIPKATVQAAYTLCRQLMMRTAKQRNRAHGDGTGDRAQFLLKVQSVAMKLDPDQKGLPVGQMQRGWSGSYLKKHPETKDLIYQALGALSDRGLGELSLSPSQRKGFRYRWVAPVTA